MSSKFLTVERIYTENHHMSLKHSTEAPTLDHQDHNKHRTLKCEGPLNVISGMLVHSVSQKAPSSFRCLGSYLSGETCCCISHRT